MTMCAGCSCSARRRTRRPTPRSDFDFLVQFLPQAAGRIFYGYFDFKEDLERLFGRTVDLVTPSAIRNPCFRKAVDQQRQVLYAA
jgi:predicted nucleotidyltransferase